MVSFKHGPPGLTQLSETDKEISFGHSDAVLFHLYLARRASQMLSPREISAEAVLRLQAEKPAKKRVGMLDCCRRGED